jgi:predicted alpha-1,2-mannosidase
LLLSCGSAENSGKSPVDYVNPYMGNISHLLVPTYPTVHLPNSMLRIYPNRADYTSDLIRGLPVIVTSHRGSSAFNISPVQGESALQPAVNYTYDREKITPYSYSVYLDEAQVQVNFAPSHRSAVYEITFEKEGDNFIIVNTRDGSMQITGEGVSGSQIIERGDTRVYVSIETEQKPVAIGILTDKGVSYGEKSVEGRNSSVVFHFGKEKTVRLRYGVSFIDGQQASQNLKREIDTYDWKQVAQKGRDIWNQTLGKIEVQGACDNDKTIFYTSLYRIYERMINISEDGRYYSAFGSEGRVHDDGGIPFYTDDWIWDTYRAAHPLRILIEPEMETNMIQSYIRMAQQSPENWMPTFPEITGDSHRMNSNHAVGVVWDAWCKGLRGFDLQAAYTACRNALMESTLIPWVRAEAGELDDFYKEKGYFPALKPGEEEYVRDVHPFEKRQPVAVTLGTSYDYWCLSQIAKTLGLEDDYQYFLKGSYNYRNLYNAQTAFFHPKNRDGNFIEPFDYRFSGGMGARDFYDENNGWVYRWDVQHNFADLVRLTGSPEAFVAHLDATFREPLGRSKFEFYAQLPDHTGNVGQYSMANEPSLHIPYLYNYAGQPWKTQKRIRSLLKQWFRNDLMGVPGDEDGGGTSAFVVFSAMGFYPVTPGMPSYNIGSPLFPYVKMDLGNGKYFEIEAVNCSGDNKYIRSAKLNGKEWNKPWFSHDDIKDGGKLVLVMGDKANTGWGTGEAPPSAE